MQGFVCADYLRLSKEDLKRKDESMSIESQRMIIESFCKFNGLELAKEYIDDGFSGSNFERPGFKKMIEDIEAGKINCVLTKDFSRLGRELYQTGTFIEDYFNQKRIRYISINDGYDSYSSDLDGSISMKLTYNDYILRDTSRKVRTSLTARKMKGQYIGSIPKYGYLKDPLDRHHLVVDPIASLVVKRMFEMALNGNNPNQIADKLTQEKIPIPIVYKKETRAALITDNDGYGIWRHQTVKDILSSEMYIGNMVQNTYEKVRYNSKHLRKLDKTEYIIVKDKHEPIIDKETFYKVNKLLEAASKSKSTFQKKNKDRYLFSGLLVCKECGHTISILEKKNKGNNSHYTQCCLYSKKGKYGLCNNHRVNYNWLEEDLISIIKEIGNDFLKEYDNNLLTNEANDILKENVSDIQSDIDLLKKEINKYNSAIEQLYMDKVQGKISESIFANLINSYNENLDIASKEKQTLENKKIEIISKVGQLDYDRCAKEIRKFISSRKPSRGLVTEIVNKVEIDNDKNIKLYFNFPELSSFVN